jgi:hypothetical protein
MLEKVAGKDAEGKGSAIAATVANWGTLIVITNAVVSFKLPLN